MIGRISDISVPYYMNRANFYMNGTKQRMAGCSSRKTNRYFKKITDIPHFVKTGPCKIFSCIYFSGQRITKHIPRQLTQIAFPCLHYQNNLIF